MHTLKNEHTGFSNYIDCIVRMELLIHSVCLADFFKCSLVIDLFVCTCMSQGGLLGSNSAWQAHRPCIYISFIAVYLLILLDFRARFKSLSLSSRESMTSVSSVLHRITKLHQCIKAHFVVNFLKLDHLIAFWDKGTYPRVLKDNRTENFLIMKNNIIKSLAINQHKKSQPQSTMRKGPNWNSL